MKMLQEGDGWDAQRRAVLYTAATLGASGAHPPQQKLLQRQLDRWDAVESQRRQADDAVVSANARVAWADSSLDEATATFGAQLLLDCNRDRSHPTYARFFPAAVTAVTNKSLEAQLREMKEFTTYGGELPLPPPSAKSLQAVVAAMKVGHAALEARAEAEREVTRVALAQAAWRDEANEARRRVDGALGEHATAEGLPRSYANRFHRATYEPKTARKRKSAAPAEPKSVVTPAPADPAAALGPHDQVLALSDVVLRGLAEDFVASLPTNVQAIVRARRAR